jgi:DNA polymerase
MDAREQLRRFLEQRKEAGETELVFDQLSVEEAMRLIGAAPGDASGSRLQAAGTEQNVPVEIPKSPSTESSDWRKVLKDAGASPKEKVGRYAMPTPATGSASTASHATMPLDEVPSGIVIGGPGKELFTGASTFSTLNELATAVATCTRCPLHREAKNPVPGEGNSDANLMCVGEAPGGREDELGRPFVGDSGQLLDKILAAIKLSREEVYICNVLKHRPPANRNPMPDEVEACSPYLLRQIELIQPRVIVAFGTFAAQTLLNTREGIGKLRGKIHRYHGVPLVVTYHPAALLRNPSWKKPAWEDVQLARKLLDRAISN